MPVRGFLQDELGVDPSPSLRKLELSILRGEDLGGGGAVRAAVEPAPALVTASDPGAASRVIQGAAVTLPAAGPGASPAFPAVPHFTGRAAEAAAMAARLTAPPPSDADGQRPLTVLVSGAPGIGKSALAQHVAHLVRDSFPAGRLLVRMTRGDGHPRTADEVAAEVAAALGPGRAGERALLVLDDVVDADQVRPLLGERHDLAVVVTSRMGLGGLIATHGGRVHRLTAFTEAESYALLLAAPATATEDFPHFAAGGVETAHWLLGTTGVREWRAARAGGDPVPPNHAPGFAPDARTALPTGGHGAGGGGPAPKTAISFSPTYAPDTRYLVSAGVRAPPGIALRSRSPPAVAAGGTGGTVSAPVNRRKPFVPWSATD